MKNMDSYNLGLIYSGWYRLANVVFDNLGTDKHDYVKSATDIMLSLYESVYLGYNA